MDVHRAIEPGVYRHFKGNYYEVIGTALHSETEEEFVVYRALYGSAGLWVRPAAMFCERVDKAKYPDAVQEYRFERIGDADSNPCDTRSSDDCARANAATTAETGKRCLVQGR